MKHCTRRRFLTTAGSLVAATGMSRALGAAQGPAPDEGPVPAPPQVTLGGTGITMSLVGQGTGMNGGNRQSNHTRLGFEKLVALFRHAYERGVTFFDLADIYGSHVYFREALRAIPRDKITILTKLWWRYDGDPRQSPADYQRRGARTALERFRHELSTDRLDIVLLHCLMTAQWDQKLAAYMEVLSEAKQRGQVRALGVSCHNIEALRRSADVPWVDVILARINPRGAKMDGPVDDVVEILKRARANGKIIIGMKIYGEGTLAHMKDECIRYAQTAGLIDAMTVGAENPAQMDETLRLVAKYPRIKA